MKRNWMRLSTAGLLAATLWVAGCSDSSQPADRLLGPDAASFARGDSRDGSGESRTWGEKRVRGRKKDGSNAEFQIVRGKLSSDLEVKEVRVIGANGGTLKAAGHVLTVPEGAVSRNTNFQIRQFRHVMEDGTVAVAVELRATVKEKNGSESDVGAQGFAKPVTLALSYAWAVNLSDDNAHLATIAWLKSDSDAEELPRGVTLNRKGKQLVGQLDHFSDYIMAIP